MDFYGWCCKAIDDVVQLLKDDEAEDIGSKDEFAGYISIRDSAVKNADEFAKLVNADEISVKEVKKVLHYALKTLLIYALGYGKMKSKPALTVNA